MIIPTWRFWILIGLGIPLAAVGALTPGAERVLIPYNLLLLALLVGTSRLVPRKEQIIARRDHDPVLSVRVPNAVRLHLSTELSHPLALRLREEPPPTFLAEQKEFFTKIPPGEEIELRYHVTPPERGSDYFRGTYVRLKAPLGLAEVEYKLQTEQPVRVYPNVLALREFELLKQRGKLNLMGIRRTRIKGLGTDFESLRDYTEGDDFRRIDWKTTARRGKLVVKEFEQERNQAVIICLDVGRRMLSEVEGVKKLDHALDACLMLMHAASTARDQVGLLVFSDTVKRYIKPKHGRSQAGVVLDTVHALQAEAVESNYTAAFSYLSSRWKRRSLLVVFTDAASEEEASSLAATLSPLAKRHIVMVVRVSDPRLKELLDITIQTPEQLYSKAAALWYANDRKHADAYLHHAGLRNIEAEPQDLAAALVSAYLIVKETAAL